MQNPIVYLYAVSLIVVTGTSLNATAGEASTLTSEPEPPPYRPWAVSLEAGTTGFGASSAWRFSDHFGARVGADLFRYSQSDLDIKGIKYDAELRLLSEPLTFDIYPWKNHSFHISVGMMFNQNELTGNTTGNGTITIGNGTVLVGTLDLKVKQQPVNPYLSIGGNLFYFDRAHRWALAGELGVVYTGDPSVSLTRSGPASPLLDAALGIEKAKVEDYAEKFQWWPVAKLAVTFSF
jgi:hypothetical protein